MLSRMGGMRRAIAATVAAAALGAGAPAYAQVPVAADNAFVIPGASFDAWAPALLEPIDPWATDGPLNPLVNANFYDCSGCPVTIIRYPRTAGPLFGPCAPFADESITIGADTVLGDLGTAEGPSVISGLSLGAITGDAAQRTLGAEPNRPPAADVTFIMTGDPSRVTPLTMGLGSFLPAGLRLPVLGWTVTRPTSESIYDTVVVVGEYDAAADFPDRPWNLLADLNAVLGFHYNHSQAALTDPADVPPEYITTTTNGNGATTTTYLVPSPELPLLKPLERILPEPILDAANKILKPMVDRGYSRNDAATGNRMPHLQATDGFARWVKSQVPTQRRHSQTAPRKATQPRPPARVQSGQQGRNLPKATGYTSPSAGNGSANRV